MDKFFFSILILSVITFIDVLITIKRPLLTKINFLVLITMIFIFNLLLMNNLKSGFILVFTPLFNVITGACLIIVLNNVITTKIYPWVKINLSIASFLAAIFVCIIQFYPFVYSFHNDQVTSFYILPKYWFLNILRFSFKVIILTTFFIIFIKFLRTKETKNYYKKSIRSWAVKLSIIAFLITFNLSILNYYNRYIIGVYILKGSLVIMSYLVLLSIIYKPKFLSFNKFSYNKLSAFDKHISLSLNDDNFTRPFFNNFYYLQKDANLDRFCKENGIDDKEDFHDLIIIKFNMSFNNLINKYRVMYFLDLVKSNKYTNYSIDALAQEAGFNSRHHLYKPFKKFHGGTPSDFIYYASN